MMTPGIDHVLLAAPNLAWACAEFQSLGFQVTPKAQHERFGTANHLCVLGDAYLELITIENRAPDDPLPQQALAGCIAAGGGLPMLALATIDLASSRRMLAAAGVDVAEPSSWSRSADTPDGMRTARFTTLFAQSEWLPGFAAFFCQHHTPQFVFHPGWQSHANGAMCLIGIECGTKTDMGVLSRRLVAITGKDAISHKSDRSLRVRLGRHELVYRRAPDLQPRRVVISVRSLAAAEAAIGARAARISAGSLLVPLAAIRGVYLLFVKELGSHE